jgi:TRAP-type C4-dicarboxylate transport system permease large subunit
VIPFIITYVVVLVILVLFPDISMFLPRLIFH